MIEPSGMARVRARYANEDIRDSHIIDSYNHPQTSSVPNVLDTVPTPSSPVISASIVIAFIA